MPITSINVAATEKFISVLDDMKDDPNAATVFHLSAMDGYQEAAIQAATTIWDTSSIDPENPDAAVKNSVDPFAGALEAARFCLTGWDRFKDDQGNDILFKTAKTVIKGRMYNVVHPEVLKLIPQSIIMEMYPKINKLGRLTSAETKNSEGALSP